MSNMIRTLKKKPIPTKMKSLVFYYIALLESKLSLENIPELIPYLILNFYYHNEYFAKCGKQVNVSNNKLSITKGESIINELYNTTYGNTWIDTNIQQIARWTLSVSTDHTKDTPVSLFLLSKDNRMDDAPYRKADKPSYGVVNDGWRVSHSSPHHESFVNLNGRDNLFGDEPFYFTLNTKDKTMCVQKKGTSDIITIYDDIKTGKNIKYKLGISIFQKGDGVSLLNFNIELE